MATCEDAPCCGCCGPAVWAADALADEERAWDRLNGWGDEDDAWGDEDEDEADDLADAWDAREDFGWAGDPALCGE